MPGWSGSGESSFGLAEGLLLPVSSHGFSSIRVHGEKEMFSLPRLVRPPIL